jgi:hypothetical protein
MSENKGHIDQFDALFKGKLDGATSQVPPGVWEGVQSAVSSAGAAAGGTGLSTAITKISALKWAGVILIPAALVTTLVVMNGDKTPSKVTSEKTISVTEKEPSKEIGEMDTKIENEYESERPETQQSKSSKVDSKESTSITSNEDPKVIDLNKSDDPESVNPSGNQLENKDQESTPTTDEVAASYPEVGEVTLKYPATACLGEKIIVQSNNDMVQWYLNGFYIKTGSEFEFKFNNDPNYRLEARLGTQSVSPKIQLLQPNADFELSLKDGKTYLTNKEPKGEHHWFLNGRKLNHSEMHDGISAGAGDEIMHIVFTNEGRCADTALQTLEMKPEEVFVDVIPEVFTPHHQDGLNDEFVVRMSKVDHYHMLIRDFNGNVVFETQNQDEYWNGKRYNMGDMLQTGNYTYLLVYVANGRKETKTGIIKIKD